MTIVGTVSDATPTTVPFSTRSANAGRWLQLVARCYQLPLLGAKKSTLMAMVHHANADGTGIRPSIKTLALEAGCCQRQARAAVRALIAYGLIRVQEPAKRRAKKVAIYAIVVEAV